MTLNESANLLDNTEADNSANSATATPGPRVSTLRMFPPEMEAIPILEEGGGWILKQRMVEPEPEKKRIRERYEDDGSSVGGKKLDERSTPEEIRANTTAATANPRNLESELEAAQAALEDTQATDVLNTQEVIEVEFGSQDHVNIQSADWDIEGHNVNLVSISQASTNINAESTTEQLSVMDRDRLMSTSEMDWMNSATFSTIPPSPGQETRAPSPALQEHHGEYGDNNEDVLFFKNAKIEELTVRLEE